MSQTKAKAVKDRLKLAVNRAYETVAKAIFGLDPRSEATSHVVLNYNSKASFRYSLSSLEYKYVE
jgi:monomeric isocitrate dehydrogenase